MSDRVTLVPCPCCGEQAAVGWMIVMRDDYAPLVTIPTEFDCAGGCSFDPAELVEVVADSRLAPSPLDSAANG